MPFKSIEDKRAWSRRYAKVWRAKNLDKAKAKERAASQKRQSQNPEQVRQWRRNFHARHRERINASRKPYFDANKERKAAYDREYRKGREAKIAMRCKAWVELNRERHNGNQRQKRLDNPQFRIANNMRVRINHALRTVGLRRNKPLESLIGCTVIELMVHLEKQFLPGMTWEGRQLWHVDHRKPCAAFDLTDPAQQAHCFHHTNLQPLWAGDNIRKSDSLPAPEATAA